MFVLVLLAHVNSGFAPATVPGYRTREQCEQAGNDFVSQQPSNERTSFRFACIRGPQ